MRPAKLKTSQANSIAALLARVSGMCIFHQRQTLTISLYAEITSCQLYSPTESYTDVCHFSSVTEKRSTLLSTETVALYKYAVIASDCSLLLISYSNKKLTDLSFRIPRVGSVTLQVKFTR